MFMGVRSVWWGKEQGQRNGHDHNRDIEQKDRAPPEVLQKEAAHGGASRRTDDGDRTPDANGRVALHLIGKGQANER